MVLAALLARPAGASPADTGAAVDPATAAQAQPAPPAPAPDGGPVRLSEEVVVQAVRAEERTPVTKTDIGRDAIDLVNRGQEMPFLLGATPAVNFQSDTGLAAGYAYFNIRGIGPTRLNITLDGVPLQDPEDQALYFSNFGDFASVVDSIQVQRGVGTSSVGAASYGGSVNFASVSPADRRGLEAQVGGGSWGTGRGTLAGNSGLLGGAWGLYARVSGQTTNGFREHSGVDQGTLYYGATRSGARSLFKLFGFSGREHTQLAYLATDEATLETDLRANALSPEETDRFGQDFVQAQYTHLAGEATTLMAQAYYNGAQGWFRIWDGGHENLQQYGIDGHFVGLVLGATHHRGRLGLNWGAHVNDFTRDHFMDVVGGARAYQNTGLKNEYSTFLKATWDAGRVRLWVDAQVRGARFEYRGDEPLGSVSWTFFNPKAGVRFDPSPTLGLYASVGRMGREPARSDMLNGEDNASLPYDLSAVEPERVVDLRGGGRAAPRPPDGPRRRLRDGVRERDRAHRRAVGDRPARAPQRGPQPPARGRARPGLRALAALAPRGDGRAQPQPHRVLDAVLRRVRRRRRLARDDERRPPGRRAAADAVRARERHGRVEADARRRACSWPAASSTRRSSTTPATRASARPPSSPSTCRRASRSSAG